MIRILTFTTLYPNAIRPGHGIFVENRLRHLLGTGEIAAEVLAPVPWFPFAGARYGEYGAFARVPRRETLHGIQIEHPRYPLIPKIGMTTAPWLMYHAMKPHIRAMIEAGRDFDLIDAHYFYPDGVAAAMLGRHFNKPVVVTARGTDINLIPEYRIPRRQIIWAASKVAGMVSVCQALKDQMVEMGVQESRIRVLRNGVDLNTFRPPLDRRKSRRQLQLSSQVIVSVGYLIPRKGHDLVIRSMRQLPGVELLIAGEGPEDGALRSLAQSEGVADRVKFLGSLPHERLAEIYGAADVLVLASSREGWANVLLESMACGTPVAATNIWGTPEVVAEPEVGVLIESRTPDSIAAAVKRVLSNSPDRAGVRAYAERFSWDETSRGQIELFRKILDT